LAQLWQVPLVVPAQFILYVPHVGYGPTGQFEQLTQTPEEVPVQVGLYWPAGHEHVVQIPFVDAVQPLLHEPGEVRAPAQLQSVQIEQVALPQPGSMYCPEGQDVLQIVSLPGEVPVLEQPLLQWPVVFQPGHAVQIALAYVLHVELMYWPDTH